MFRTQFFREATAGGGSSINPSLSELESGDGSTKTPDLAAEAAKQAAAAAQQQQGAGGDSQQQQQQNPQGDGQQQQQQGAGAASQQQQGAGAEAGKDGAGADVGKGNNAGAADGAGKDGEGAAGEDGEGSDGTGDEEDYYAVVDKLNGRTLEIEYPEGIDPVTPEGTAFRENFIREQTFTEFEEHLKATNPRGWAYMLHLQNGGTDQEFFTDPSKGFVLPSLEDLKDSVDVQKAVLSQDLQNKGLDKETIDTIIEKAIKDNKLLEKATSSFNFITENQAAFLKEQERLVQENYQQTTAAVKYITTKFAKAAEEMSFIIPENKKAEFNQFVVNNLQMTDDGKFMLVQEVNPDDLKGITESLFFQFAKGDLNQFVQKKVKTETAQRLRLQTEKTKTTNTRDTGTGNSGQRTLTLGEL